MKLCISRKTRLPRYRLPTAIPNRSSSVLSEPEIPILSLIERWRVIMPAYAMKTGIVEKIVLLKHTGSGVGSALPYVAVSFSSGTSVEACKLILYQTCFTLYKLAHLTHKRYQELMKTSNSLYQTMPEKMSFLEGITQMVIQLRSSIDNEEQRLEKNLGAGIRKVVEDTTTAHRVVFSDIITVLQTSREIVSEATIPRAIVGKCLFSKV